MNFIIYLIVKAIMFLINAVFPLALTFWLTEKFGTLSYLILKKRKKIALENIRRAFGDTLTQQEKNSLVKSAFQSAALSMVELFLVGRILKDAQQRFTIHHVERYKEVFEKGKGLVFVVAHLGSWEYLEFLQYLTETKMGVIVKDMKNAHVNELVNRQRRLTQIKPMSKVNSVRPALKALKKNESVAILIDQWSGPEGIWVDFFGEETSTTSIPARLAKITGASFVPACCIRSGYGKYDIYIEPSFELNLEDPEWEKNTTIKLNQILEKQIKKHPSQWLWGHRRWKPMPSIIRDPSEEARK